MAQRGITLHIPFSIVFDDTVSNDDDAIRDLYRIFEESEQAGFFDRTVIDPTYGEPVERITFVPEPTDDEDGDETFTEPCDRCSDPIPSNRDRSPNYCKPCAVIVAAQQGDED